jgi:2',3'-cyclic-nucleotide 2'-phosphodiesterase (5'-nucleotidase family)
MIGKLFRNPRCSATLACGWPIMAAIALTAGLGWYALSTQAASAGLSALPGQVNLTPPDSSSVSIASSAVVTLTILHTNDTWGYVDPCG